MNIAEMIRSNRKRLGLSQVALADELKCSQPSVSHWERGKAIPDMKNCVLLEQTLNLPPGSLLIPCAYLLAGESGRE